MRRWLVAGAVALGGCQSAPPTFVWNLPDTSNGSPSDADCQQAENCKSYGRCTAKDGVCIASKDADCQQADYCKSYGMCTAKDGRCFVESDSDAGCQKLAVCKSWGWCTAKDGVCIASKDADCQQTDGCKSYGFCTAKDGVCLVSKDADCQQNDPCKSYGFCTAKDGGCIPTVCVEAGYHCSVNGDCCGSASCLSDDYLCHDACTSNAQCKSKCCAALKNGGAACGPPSWCP